MGSLDLLIRSICLLIRSLGIIRSFGLSTYPLRLFIHSLVLFMRSLSLV
jgi:hypothetical protein